MTDAPGPRVIPAILSALNAEVLSELDLAASIDHPGESGRAREQIITRFLRRLIPTGFAVSTGFVIDAVGGISRQIDLVVYRTGYHPVLEIGGVSHFLAESVVAVIENKAAIDSAADLSTALENVASVKRLDRSNRGLNKAFRVSGGAEPFDPDAFQHQVFGAVVTERSLSSDRFWRELLRFALNHPKGEWPNHYVDVHRFAAGYWTAAHQHSPTDLPHASFGAEPLEHLAIADAGPGWFPLVSLAYELCNYLRVAPVVDYSASAYLSPPEVGRYRWFRITQETLTAESGTG